MNTTGNTVFISGGSAGIGLAIAKKLSAAGNKVIINGRSKDRLDQALNELPGAIAIQGDLSLEADRIRIASELQLNHPQVNVIINNAGAAFDYTLAAGIHAHEKAMAEMNTNYFAVIHFTELMLAHLLQQPQAAIVNITSIAVYGSHKAIPTYGASKAALHSYTTALRDTYAAQQNLGIYEVYPPLVNTEFSAAIGGANGIPASEVADELLIGLQNNQYDIPVGDTKIIASAMQQVFAKLQTKTA